MSSSVIAYTPIPETTREAETDVLAHVYKLVLDCYAKKEAIRPDGPDDPRKDKDARTYFHST